MAEQSGAGMSDFEELGFYVQKNRAESWYLIGGGLLTCDFDDNDERRRCEMNGKAISNAEFERILNSEKFSGRFQQLSLVRRVY